MKRQRISLVLVTAGIVSTSLFLTAFPGVSDNDSDAEIVRAYMEAPDVATEIDNFRQQAYQDDGARTMLISRNCGVAGCGLEYLVVHLFSTNNVNPQTRSILARVSVLKALGRTKVELMEVTPKQERPVPYQQLRVIEKVPAPNPDLSAEPKP